MALEIRRCNHNCDSSYANVKSRDFSNKAFNSVTKATLAQDSLSDVATKPECETTKQRSNSLFSPQGCAKFSPQEEIVKRRLSLGSRNGTSQNKTKLTQLLKTNQLEQLSKLQNKHQQDCDLLDDIRNFGKQRSQLDKEYGQALQKLVSQYQKKDWPNFIEAEDTDKMPVLAIWKALLDATEKSALVRVTNSENYKNNIYEAAKNCKSQKDVQLKKCQELLNNLHSEVAETVKELAKAKKKYFDMKQNAVVACEKYDEVNERLKKNQISIFKSKAGLEKAFQKLQQKCDESTLAATIARNEYLFMISATNAHQKRYYEVDMPEAMRVLDGEIYSYLQDYLALLNRYELEACAASTEAFTHSLHCTSKISRDYNTRCFLRDNPIFERGPLYSFEASGKDEAEGKLQEEQAGNDNSLNREARKWTYRVERDKKQLERLDKIKQGLMAKSAEKSSTDAGAQETEVRLEKCKQDIRKTETECLQGEARLAMLRDANVELDSWIESARTQLAKEIAASVTSPRRMSIRRKPSTPQVENPYQNGGSFIEADESFYDDDYMDEFDETFEDNYYLENDNLSIPSSEHSRVYPVTCVVIYPYQASRADELSITVGDKVEVVEDGDLDQWVKARDGSGRTGYVPENYLDFPPVTSSSQQHAYALPPGDDATSVCDSTSTSTSGTSSLTTTSSANDREVCKINSITNAICLAKASYEYEACTEEELSFPEGAIINVISKDDNGVDDGWWKGELNGKIGVFPGLVVEELGGNAVKSDSSPTASPFVDEPPSFVPPPPNVHPPPPPPDSNKLSPDVRIPRNASWDGRTSPFQQEPAQSSLTLPEIRHSRALSAPSQETTVQLGVKPTRAAPAPPKRPSSYMKS